MKMDEGLDTGPMLHQQSVSIANSDTRKTLENKLCLAGKRALLYALDNLETLFAGATKQDEQDSTYAEKLKKTDSLINWGSPAEGVNRTIRAGIGRFPAYTFLDGDRLRITEAIPKTKKFDQSPGSIVELNKEGFIVSCLNSSLQVKVVQLPGKNIANVHQILTARPLLFAPGKSFGNSEAES